MISLAIVEDNSEIRRNLARFIGEVPGFRITSLCSTGEEALKIIPNQPPDIVLMDIQLPGINGIDCTTALKQKLPKLRVMMLTVYEDSDAIFDALKAGASGYLLKRSAPDRLIEAIKELHQGGSPMTSEIARKVIDSFHNAKPATHPQDRLTHREEEVLQLLAKGYSAKEIGAKLNLSYETIRVHLKRVYEKLHVHSRTEAVLKYRQ